MIRIEAPHFIAGVVMDKGVAVDAAPIVRWMIGRTEEWIKLYCERRKWVADEI